MFWLQMKDGKIVVKHIHSYVDRIKVESFDEFK